LGGVVTGVTVDRESRGTVEFPVTRRMGTKECSVLIKGHAWGGAREERQLLARAAVAWKAAVPAAI
jgi:hypothetical protein